MCGDCGPCVSAHCHPIAASEGHSHASPQPPMQYRSRCICLGSATAHLAKKQIAFHCLGLTWAPSSRPGCQLGYVGTQGQLPTPSGPCPSLGPPLALALLGDGALRGAMAVVWWAKPPPVIQAALCPIRLPAGCQGEQLPVALVWALLFPSLWRRAFLEQCARRGSGDLELWVGGRDPAIETGMFRLAGV